jgi:lysophospholipase L1-like esterase
MLALFLMGACSKDIKTTPVTQEVVPKDIVYVALGDSLSEGVGDELNYQGYVGRLSDQMETWKGVNYVEVQNTAKKGRRSDQLVAQLESGEIDKALKKADFITMTMGGNDLMKIVRRDIMDLNKGAFDEERLEFQERYGKIMELIRERNKSAPIIIISVYNPLSIFTQEKSDLNTIMYEWNTDIQDFALADKNACFVNVEDLFDTNENMIYHTDFFHPNAKGYDEMTGRIVESIKACGLKKLTNGEMDFKE